MPLFDPPMCANCHFSSKTKGRSLENKMSLNWLSVIWLKKCL